MTTTFRPNVAGAATAAAANATPRSLGKGVPPLRPGNDARVIDKDDGQRIAWSAGLWTAQDGAWRLRDRQVEENIRMLSGQQWVLWHPLLGKYIDITEWMSDEDLRWRQRPVFNRLLPWFILTHARLTENPPVLTFVPGPDRLDAEMAEVLDVLFKAKWREAGMTDAWDRVAAWLIPGGRAYMQSRIDITKGPLRPWVGRGLVPMVDAYDQPIDDGDGGQAHFEMEEGVPFGPDGEPVAVYRQYEDGTGELVPKGKPHTERRGQLVVDVHSPLEVRGTWGPQPWHMKPMHQVRSYLTPEEVYEHWGVECEPDVRGTDGSGELQRLLYGAGYFGATSAMSGSETSTAYMPDGLCEVTSTWRAPCAYGGMEETEDSPGGRLLIHTRKKVLVDGPRPARFKYTSPIRCFDFIRVPGRAQGTTPQESMNPLQRSYNRGWGQIQEHRNLTTNPIRLIHSGSGLQKLEWTNEPGTNLVHNAKEGTKAVEWLVPPPLSEDVYRTQRMLAEEFEVLGNLTGTSGEAPSSDPSGELVKELRFNSDRFLGPTLRRSVEEFARMGEDWIVLMPALHDEEEVIAYAGEDNVARTITVYPQLFEQGRVNVVPDVESMLPEGRGERQARIEKMYADGKFGPPGTPQALKMYFDLARFPHLSRAAKPGGIDRVTADQENGQLLQGVPAAEIPVYDWYDDDVHIESLESFMKSPEYKRLPPNIQYEFVAHRDHHLQSMIAKQQGVAPPPPDGAPGAGAPVSDPSAPPPPSTPEDGSAPAEPVTPEPASEHAPDGVEPGMYPTAI